jgi:hypothetical protein
MTVLTHAGLLPPCLGSPHQTGICVRFEFDPLSMHWCSCDALKINIVVLFKAGH